MARPREFDETDVLDRALKAFWARGFDATSVDDLATATGLGKASLYGAFGDKEQLFRRVLQHYLQRTQAQTDDATQHLSARKALEAFLALRVACASSKDGTSGCFLQIAATTGTSAKLVQEAAEETTRIVKMWLLRQLKAAQANGELASSASPAALADFLLVMLNGLSASARAGLPPKTLKAAADEAIGRVFSA